MARLWETCSKVFAVFQEEQQIPREGDLQESRGGNQTQTGTRQENSNPAKPQGKETLQSPVKRGVFLPLPAAIPVQELG